MAHGEESLYRLAAGLELVGPTPARRMTLAPVVQPILDISLSLTRTRLMEITIVDSGGGSSDVAMGTPVPDSEAWEVLAWYAERTAGDNQFSDFLVADAETDSDPMPVDTFSSNTTRLFSAGDQPPGLWLYPRDSIGHNWAGAGVAATTVRHRLWVRRFLWKPGEP